MEVHEVCRSWVHGHWDRVHDQVARDLFRLYLQGGLQDRDGRVGREVQEVREVWAGHGVLVRHEVLVVHEVLVLVLVRRGVRHEDLGVVLSGQPYRRFFGEGVLILVEEVACHQMV